MHTSALPDTSTVTDVMSYGDRLEWAARLRRLGLVHAERYATSVQMWYSAPYHPEVRRWAAQEAECSPWLAFTLTRLPTGTIALTITAAPEACPSVDELFAEVSGLG